MPVRRLSVLIAFFAISYLPATFAQENWIGSLKTVSGTVTLRRAGAAISASEGTRLKEKDTIETGSDGRGSAILQDGTRFSMGPNSRITIDQFLYNPAQGQAGMLLQMFRGVAAFISGKIPQFAPDSTKVETPVGIVGLRGTEFAISLEQP
jgi:hypothetical protein